LYASSGRKLLIPRRVFNTEIKTSRNDNSILVYAGRDNCAIITFFHDNQKLYLEDVKDIHLIIDKKTYINNIHKFLEIDKNSGVAFFKLNKFNECLFNRGKNVATVVLFTDTHQNGIVFSDNLIIQIL
jgi:hypothetical protein